MSDEGKKPDSSDDENQDCKPASDEIRLEPAGEVIVTQHKEAQPPPPGKSIHPRRPMPPVPEKPGEEEK